MRIREGWFWWDEGDGKTAYAPLDTVESVVLWPGPTLALRVFFRGSAPSQNITGPAAEHLKALIEGRS